jgi:glycosyltransferase involved in cell wall biosynthesis
VLPLYYLVCDRYMRGWSEGIRDNLTLVNSDWTGAWFRSVHGGVTTTCYPPVSGAFPDVPWDDRDPTFLCLGRIAHEKNLDAVIDIVAEVRRTWPEVRLRVVGSAYADAYSAHILARMARHADWITVHLDVSHAEVRTLISRCRYGLHGMHHEHFGMAPAEMVTGGCLVWVHDSGGQVEVVGREPRLVYTTVEDGVQRILRVLADERAQAELRAHLAARARLFSLDAFSSGVRGAAARQLARQADAAATSARNSG